MFWGVLFVLYAFDSVKIVKRLIRVVSCCIELNRIEELPCQPIRLRNMQDTKESLGKALRTCIVTLLILVVCGYIAISRTPSIYYILAFVIMILLTCMNLVVGILGYRFVEECFLSKDGIHAVQEILRSTSAGLSLGES